MSINILLGAKYERSRMAQSQWDFGRTGQFSILGGGDCRDAFG